MQKQRFYFVVIDSLNSRNCKKRTTTASFVESKSMPKVKSAHLQKFWVAVASLDHCLKGAQGGFCQACHGKAAPIARMKPGDWMVYYSPKTEMNAGTPVRKFTTLGQVQDSKVEKVGEMVDMNASVLVSHSDLIVCFPFSPQFYSVRYGRWICAFPPQGRFRGYKARSHSTTTAETFVYSKQGELGHDFSFGSFRDSSIGL
jgi:hypothetical protein